MSSFGGMPARTLAFSASFHLAIAGLLYGLYHFHLFRHEIIEDTPLVVQIVNPAALTRATEVNPTPPKPDKPPETAQAEPPKPEPKPEPPPPPPPAPEPAPKPPEVKPVPPLPPPPPPEPKPAEAKLEPPKAPPPKPEPPKQKDDVMSDELLRNIAKRSPTRVADDQPKQVAAVEPKASSQPIAPLGSQLTTNELDAIKQQLRECWLVPAGARDAKDLRPEFRVYMNQDGTVRSASQLNPERNSDPFFQAAAESAMRALRNPRCQPLKLPPQKYDAWQTFTITFDPKDLL